MVANNVDTIREQILDAIECHFKTQAQGDPAPDPYTITWSLVDRVDLSDLSHGKAYTIAILEGGEAVTPGVSTLEGVTTKTLGVTCEWHSMLEAKQRPATEANRILGEIIRRMLEDETYGGLAIWIQETGNEAIIDNQNDRQIEGSVSFNVLYRHSRQDPRAVII